MDTANAVLHDLVGNETDSYTKTHENQHIKLTSVFAHKRISVSVGESFRAWAVDQDFSLDENVPPMDTNVQSLLPSRENTSVLKSPETTGECALAEAVKDKHEHLELVGGDLQVKYCGPTQSQMLFSSHLTSSSLPLVRVCIPRVHFEPNAVADSKIQSEPEAIRKPMALKLLDGDNCEGDYFANLDAFGSPDKKVHCAGEIRSATSDTQLASLPVRDSDARIAARFSRMPKFVKQELTDSEIGGVLHKRVHFPLNQVFGSSGDLGQVSSASCTEIVQDGLSTPGEQNISSSVWESHVVNAVSSCDSVQKPCANTASLFVPNSTIIKQERDVADGENIYNDKSSLAAKLIFHTQSLSFDELTLQHGSALVPSAKNDSRGKRETTHAHENVIRYNNNMPSDCSTGKSYACSECERSFDRASKLKSHSLIHALLLKSTFRQSKSSASGLARKPYECWKCKARFERQSQLDQHKSTHMNMGYVCNKCKTTFKKPSYWKTHMKKCNGTSAIKIQAFTCKACNMEFQNVRRFKIHMRSHLGPRPHTCPHCPAAYSTPSKLKCHMYTHTGERPFVCQRCSAAFVNPYYLRRHEQRCYTFDCASVNKELEQNNKNTCGEENLQPRDGSLVFKYFLCKTCNDAFTSQELLWRHHYTHQLFQFKCRKCSVNVCTYSALKQHQLACLRKGNFMCGQCKVTFDRYEHLKRHLTTCARTYGKPMVYACGECFASFLQSSMLVLHMQSHASQQLHGCQQCNASFEWKNSLSVHVRMAHGPKPPAQSSTQMAALVTCIICHLCRARFNDDSPYQEHLAEQHPAAVAVETQRTFPGTFLPILSKAPQPSAAASELSASTPTSTGGKPKSCFKCVACSSTFSHKNNLDRHMATAHIGCKPYKCGDCSATFSRADYLKKHAVKHSDNPTPHACTKCGAKFTERSSLKVHMRKHAGHRLYTCPLCPATFLYSSSLKVHTDKHGKQTRCVCEVCGMSFTHLSSLKVHSRRHSGLRPYSCQQCFATFAYTSSLKVHQRKHIGSKPYECSSCHKTFTHISSLKVHERKTCNDRAFSTKTSLKQHESSSATQEVS